MAKLTNSEQVSADIAKRPAELRPAIEYLRQLMLSIDENIAEHIKWNSPAFYYSGTMKAFDPKEYKRDILVMNLVKNKLLCILPTGMNIKTHTELLEGEFTDGRRLISFKDLDDIKAKAEKLKETIREWLETVER